MYQNADDLATDLSEPDYTALLRMDREPAPRPDPAGARSGLAAGLHHTEFLVFLAHRRLRGAANEALRMHRIDMRHAGVLAALAERGPRSQRGLGDALRLDRSSMVAVVDELERQGLVERRRPPRDRRAYALHLTDAGQHRLDAARDAVAAAVDGALATLSPAERAQLDALLARLVEQDGPPAG